MADRALTQNDVALAALNYRRAVAASPNSADGQVARRAMAALQREAESQLLQVGKLIASEQYGRAFENLNELWRDYSTLPVTLKIEQARRRVVRLQDADPRAANLEAESPARRAPRDAATGDGFVVQSEPTRRVSQSETGRDSLSALIKLAQQVDR